MQNSIWRWYGSVSEILNNYFVFVKLEEIFFEASLNLTYWTTKKKFF